MNTKKILFFVTVAVLVVAFAVSAFLVGRYIMDTKRQEDLYAKYEQMDNTTAAPEPTAAAQETEEAAQSTEAAQATEATEPGPTEPVELKILPELEKWYNANPDTVGHIEIPGTKLNYPVVQTMDNRDYYLKRDFEKRSSEYGAIYAELADINEPSDNITLYGHNMKNGTMFGSLHAYTSKDHWEKNKLIIFNTLYERHTYRIFAVFKTNADVGQGWDYHKFIDAENEEEFNEFVRIAKYGREEGGRVVSFYETDITPVYGDKLITLSTCEYTMGQNGRLVVCAVRKT